MDTIAAPLTEKSSSLTIWDLVRGLATIICLGALLLPAIAVVKEQARKSEAQAAVAQIASAVKNFYTEYGRYPLAATSSEDVTLSSDNNRLFDILRALHGTEAENSRHIVFFDGRVAGSISPKSGFGSNGVYYDPWGTAYQIRIDTNYDERVTNPYDKNSASNPLRNGVIVWALGSDGKPGDHGDGNSSADIISWR